MPQPRLFTTRLSAYERLPARIEWRVPSGNDVALREAYAALAPALDAAQMPQLPAPQQLARAAERQVEARR